MNISVKQLWLETNLSITLELLYRRGHMNTVPNNQRIFLEPTLRREVAAGNFPQKGELSSRTS